MKKYLFLILALLCVFTYPQDKGKKAPNFKLENIDGATVELNKQLGNGPVLLSFWATWCKPCVEELTEFKKIYSDYKSKGFKIIAISTDNEKTVSKVKPFVKAKDIPFMVLLDTNSEVARKYYAQSVPFTVLIDKDGNVVFTHMGYMKGDELQVRKKLEELYK